MRKSGTIIRLFTGTILGLLLVMPAGVSAEPVEDLTSRLLKNLTDPGIKRVAVLPFRKSEGVNEGQAQIIQERITTYLTQSGRLEVIERSLLLRILKEKNLEESGLVDRETTRELGRVLGVHAIISGSISRLNRNNLEVNARIIQSDTLRILAAERTRVDLAWGDGNGSGGQTIPIDFKPGDRNGRPLMQIAILLDTSSSMDGLIDQTRTQLWKIVNELASAEKGGNNPILEVALFEYGNDNLSDDLGFVRMVQPFTRDLDHISEKLFALKTNGGQEFCGQAIQTALSKLKWSANEGDYRAIFIAGNEPFTQGPVDFRLPLKNAAQRKIIVNTIYCGSAQMGRSTSWATAASLAGGDFMSIQQNRQIQAIKAPQDRQIQKEGRRINETFIPYGDQGRDALARQEKEDENADRRASSGSSVNRYIFKGKKQYSQSSTWDLVTLVETGKLKIKDIDPKKLPPKYRKLSKARLKKVIQAKIAERKKIRAKISKLSKDRTKYITKEKLKRAKSNPDNSSIDKAMSESIRRQSKELDFKFN